MRDLRLIESDENSIVLETADGEKFKLEVDHSVKTAIRTAGAKPTSSSDLSPRDIQDRVRSGQSIDEIVTETGADAGFVETFALPVIDELQHMVASARSVRLTIPGDRFNDDSQIEFGELVDRRLTDNGATSLVWSSKRAESAVWLVSVSFELAGNYGVASWLFDPRKVELTAEDETASALSVLEGNPGPLPKSRFATEPPAAFRKKEPASHKSTSAPSSEAVAPVIDLAAAREPQIEAVVASHDAAAELRDPEPAVMNVTTLQFKAEPVSQPLLESELEETETVIDEVEVILVEEQEEVDFIEPDDLVEVVEVVEIVESTDLVDEPAIEDVPEADIADDVPPAQPPQEAVEPPTSTGSIGIAKKGRASMPSWDEIVFGTKTDD